MGNGLAGTGGTPTLVGEGTANIVFGLGVLAMGLSTISLLMLISGFVVVEIFGFEHGGIQHKLGTLLPATGLLWPFLWSGKSVMYLAIPTSVFGYVLLPVAYVTFFLMMNSKRMLGEHLPRGNKRILWNSLMGISLLITGSAAAYTAWGKKMNDFYFGRWALGLFILAVVIGHFVRAGRKEPAGN